MNDIINNENNVELSNENFKDNSKQIIIEEKEIPIQHNNIYFDFSNIEDIRSNHKKKED